MGSERTSLLARRHHVRRVGAVLLLSGLSLLAPLTPLLAQDAVDAAAISDQRFAPFIGEASQRFGIPEKWIRAVMHAESEHADDVSSAGAMGLMQIMPDTWTELRARYDLGAGPFDPHDNIIAGAAYLRELLDRYGNTSAMLAAYNAGPARYDEYLDGGRTLPSATQEYVAKLAPILGGAAPPNNTTIAPLQPVDWREAPLFVVPGSASSSASSLQPDHHSAASALSTSASTNGAAGVSAGSMFVAVSGRSSAP